MNSHNVLHCVTMQYADDTKGLVSGMNSGKHFLKTFERFGSLASPNLNKEKREGE